jgi:peptidoglycan hydrolase CwlO-like protein
MDTKLKQREMDLHAARVQVEKLEQQIVELSSKLWSVSDKAERSSQALKEAWMVLQKWKAVLPNSAREE